MTNCENHRFLDLSSQSNLKIDQLLKGVEQKAGDWFYKNQGEESKVKETLRYALHASKRHPKNNPQDVV